MADTHPGLDVTLTPSLLQTLTDVTSVRQRLAEVEAAGDAVDQHLADLARGLATVPRLADLGDVVGGLVATIPGVEAKAAATITEAEAVIERTRVLDAAQTRVQAALERVEDVLDLKSCLTGVQVALKEGNLQSAAAQLKRFRSVEALVPVLEEDAETMRAAEQQLSTVVEEQFQAAISSNDTAAVTTCCQLLNILGRSHAGLHRYVDFLEATLRSDLDALPAADTAATDAAATVNQLSAVFARGVGLLREADQVTKDNFGDGDGPLRVLGVVHKECDARAAAIVTAFLCSNRIKTALVHSAALSDAAAEATAGGTPGTPRRGADGGSTPRTPGTPGAAAPPTVADAQHVALLNEAALIVQRCMSYAHAVGARVASDTPADHSPLVQHALLASSLAELCGVYTQLESGFLMSGLVAAHAADELLDDGLTSSVVEESFYVLQQCGMRALLTGNPDCACGVVNHMVRGLETVLLEDITSRVNSGRDALALAVNNAELCERYTERLVQELRDIAAQRFPEGSREAGMVESCVVDLAVNTSRFRRLVHTGLTRVRDQLAPTINSALTVFKGDASLVSYHLSEEEYSRLQVTDVFGVCLERLKEVLDRYQPQLSPTLYTALVSTVAVFVSKQVEKLITFKRFTLYGGMQFDKDMRALVSFFADRSDRGVRNKLSRLLQMARLLSLETPSELLEYWGANEGPVPWEFNAAEARRTLQQRADFNPAEINALAL